MQTRAMTLAVGLGMGATMVTALAGVQPAVGIYAGAVVAVAVLWRSEPVRPYAIVGTAWGLSLAMMILLLPIFPEQYTQTTQLALFVVGLMSVGVLVLREILKWMIKRTILRTTSSDMTQERASSTISSIVGTIVLAYSVLSAKERIARSGLVGFFGSFSFLFEIVGIQLEIPFIFVEGLNLTLFVLIGAVIVGFHTLSSWHGVFLLKKDENVRAAGREAKKAASDAGEVAKQRASRTGDTFAATIHAARENLRDTKSDS